MNINKGMKFRCIEDVFDFDGKPIFIKGNCYIANTNGYLAGEGYNSVGRNWSGMEEYFELIKMKIEKGNKFLCIKDVVMFDGDIAYKKGEIYQSECDGCITNINREDCHRWTSEDAPHFYFKPLKEVDLVYTDATDRIRELHDNYTGDKFGSPSNAEFFEIKLSDNDVLFLCANDGYKNIFLTYGYVTEDTFIELIGMNVDQEEDYDDPYNWVVNGMKDDISNKKDVIVQNNEHNSKETFNPKPYYDNSKGSLYKVATERGWGAYLFDVVKRLERGGKKDPLKQEIEKSIDVLKIWLNEID